MRKIKIFTPFILLGIVTLFSLGKTLSYYFFTDDFAFLYYLGHNLDFGWPYTSVLPLFRPIYNLFGITPFPYLLLAMLTYFFAGVAVYFTARQLTQSRLVATLSSLIFATGYIGLEQFSLIAVSIINNLNVINVCITLILLIKWIESREIKFYLLTLLMFWLSIALFPYRAYPLILFLPTIELIKNFKLESLKKQINKIIFLIVRYIPFILLASLYGLFSYGTVRTIGTKEVNLFSIITDPNSKLFTLLNIEFLKELFGVLGKLILVKSIIGFLNIAPDLNLYAFWGLILFIITILVSLALIIRKKEDDGRNLLIALLLTIEAYVGNMILHTDFAGNGAVNRYLTIAFLPFSILIVLFLFSVVSKFEKIKLFNKKYVALSGVLFVILVYSLLSQEYEKEIIKERSEPSKTFFKEIKTYIPRISGSSYNVFYFDRASYFPVSSRFGNVLLSAAMSNSVNLAVPYDVNIGSIKIVDTFDQFLRFIIYPPNERKTNYYTFYSNEKGLQNTTGRVFDLLKNGSNISIPNNQIHYDNKDGTYSISVDTKNVSSLTPLKATFSLRATPQDLTSFSFSYVGTTEESVRDYYERNNIQKGGVFKYLISRDKYYKTVSADVESIHIGKQNPASYLIDEKAETVWLSDQSRWEVNIKPWIKIDLSGERNIGRVVWRELPTRHIDKFTISTSLDGENWTKVKNISENAGPIDPDQKIIDFDNTFTRYILVTIDELSYGSPGPGLAEIEVVENDYKSIDFESAMRVKNSPFEYIKDSEELSQTYDYLSLNAKIAVKALTNRDDSNSNLLLLELPIFLDGEFHKYEFQIPPGGTDLKMIFLKTNFPANISLENVVLENIRLEVLKDKINKKCQEFIGRPEWMNPFDCK